jgi:hypothetical protein
MKNLKIVTSTLAIAGLLNSSLFFTACNNPPKAGGLKDTTTTAGMDEGKCKAKAELRTAMRKLWEDHVTWTRNVIFNIMDGLPGTDQAIKRLLQNQDDIGNAIKPYYGNEAGDKLAALLHTHITQAADLLKAAKATNTAEFDRLNKEWYANADEISAFLSGANPNWKLSEMKEMMHDHLKLTTDEAVARSKKDYDADVKAYDKVHDEILKMSDMLYMGIVEQFPDKVK